MSAETQQEALGRARTGESFSNYPAIFTGFMDKGIPEAEIIPRENVFTFHAWKALGRVVKKGGLGRLVGAGIGSGSGSSSLVCETWKTVVVLGRRPGCGAFRRGRPGVVYARPVFPRIRSWSYPFVSSGSGGAWRTVRGPAFCQAPRRCVRHRPTG